MTNKELEELADALSRARAQVQPTPDRLPRRTPAAPPLGPFLEEALGPEPIDREALAATLELARAAIRDCIRRPLGVEPDSATVALKALEALLGRIKGPA